MKYAAVVLRNLNHSVSSVNYACVTDALLSGGVLLDEVVLLPYDAPAAVTNSIARLARECDGVFVICDKVLLSPAREAVSVAVGKEFTGTLLETPTCLFAVLPAGERGGEIARAEVIPAVDKRRGTSYGSVVVRTVAAPAEKVLAAVADAQDEADGTLSIHASEIDGCGRIEVIYDGNTPKVTVDEIVRILASELEPYVYALEDVPIAERLFAALKLHRLKIATAESFTGGGVGQAIVSNPGASKVFYEGLNVYDEEAKKARLGVSEYTLKNKGAVSNETAYEMAAGLLRDGVCDVAVATTGIAGPDSDASGKPAGLCYIAVGTRERVRVFEYRLEGDRGAVTRKAVNLALFHAYKEIR